MMTANHDLSRKIRDLAFTLRGGDIKKLDLLADEVADLEEKNFELNKDVDALEKSVERLEMNEVDPDEIDALRKNENGEVRAAGYDISNLSIIDRRKLELLLENIGRISLSDVERIARTTYVWG